MQEKRGNKRAAIVSEKWMKNFCRYKIIIVDLIELVGEDEMFVGGLNSIDDVVIITTSIQIDGDEAVVSDLMDVVEPPSNIQPSLLPIHGWISWYGQSWIIM